MEFKIPKSYTVGGQDMTVNIVDKIDNTSNLGRCCVPNGTVMIADTWDGIKQSESSKLNTFFHELTHSILETMQENDLNNSEKFVGTFASFLTEAIRTMEG